MQGFNMGRYHPPDEDGKRRKRIKTKNVVRFEMPFAVWCYQCQNLISQGTRFNAEKKQIGSYYSSKIWSFTFHCHTCSNAIEIHTDPKNTEYVVCNGGKRRIDAASTGTISSVATDGNGNHDPLEALEKSVATQKKKEDQNTELELIYEKNERQWADPMTVSQKLRKRFREKKKMIKEQEQLENELKDQAGLGFSLLPPTVSDEIIAHHLVRHERTGSHMPTNPDNKKIFMKKKERFANFDDTASPTGFLRFPKVLDTKSTGDKVTNLKEHVKIPEKNSTASLVEYGESDEST
ncbi:complexed with Cdc5 protein Cwf16 [Schizosaccharomyces octosporus yFS286]|uniref:Complexed with Cdc5 protein Cwf16 n=1 Tax=Schizosaccharomyces octosporus (strain yFS286) TaxID=483514 RepID=S9RJ26_SCHOY|nr:complexed with Cdc5 protein Cwf16 [Schizosaccharomyces octosporus yFS286]EPX74014.1 complexed with Cdc5 protein Cwf16 [Schizosaccharomyces octosporus yFS286]